jgi:hypothetical protein
MRELQQVRLLRELESGSRASEGGAQSVAGRLLRRGASRNDNLGVGSGMDGGGRGPGTDNGRGGSATDRGGYAARDGSGGNGGRGRGGVHGSGDGGRGCESAEAWREYEARHAAEKRAECDRLLIYSAAQKAGAAIASDPEKQSQFPGHTELNSLDEAQLREKTANSTGGRPGRVAGLGHAEGRAFDGGVDSAGARK